MKDLTEEEQKSFDMFATSLLVDVHPERMLKVVANPDLDINQKADALKKLAGQTGLAFVQEYEKIIQKRVVDSLQTDSNSIH
jgi:hypothetical protein